MSVKPPTPIKSRLDPRAPLHKTQKPGLIARLLPSGDIGLTVEFPGHYDNLMVWLDGMLIVEQFDDIANPPYNGHSWDHTANTTNIVLDHTRLTLADGPIQVTVSVWPSSVVGPNGVFVYTTAPIVPTDGGSGVNLNTQSVQAIGSRIVRTLFHCSQTDVTNDNIKATLLAAGVSHLSLSIFTSPADHPTQVDYASWLAQWNSQIKPGLDYCVTNGFRIIGIGDDFFRTQAEQDWVHTSPFAQQAVEHVASYLAGLGICDGVEMVDEVGNDPTAYAPDQFIGWWRGQNGPPLAWPNQGPYAWEVPQYSDYSSRYWTDLEWRAGEAPPYNITGWQYRNAFQRAALNVPTTRLWSCLVSCTGPFYTKRVSGSAYQNGDFLQKGGVKPNDIIKQVWLAMAYGASNVRLYGYDWGLWRGQRQNAAIGDADLQTGSRPALDSWSDLSAALNSLASREAQLIGTHYEPVESWPWTHGRRGSLRFAINLTDRPLVSPIGQGMIVSSSGESVGTVVPGGCVVIIGV